MISRVRVEVRATSMDEAKREAHIFLQHARQAGYLEGICPQSSRQTDDHFGEVLGQLDEWHALDANYEGRITFTFDPQPPMGPVAQLEFKVTADTVSDEGSPTPDVTRNVIVLTRHNRSDSATAELDEMLVIDRAWHEFVPTNDQGSGFLVEVWLHGLPGETHAAVVYGTVKKAVQPSSRDFRQEEHPPIFEYRHDLRVGESADQVVADVAEKMMLQTDAYRRALNDRKLFGPEAAPAGVIVDRR